MPSLPLEQFLKWENENPDRYFFVSRSMEFGKHGHGRKPVMKQEELHKVLVL